MPYNHTLFMVIDAALLVQADNNNITYLHTITTATATTNNQANLTTIRSNADSTKSHELPSSSEDAGAGGREMTPSEWSPERLLHMLRESSAASNAEAHDFVQGSSVLDRICGCASSEPVEGDVVRQSELGDQDAPLPPCRVVRHGVRWLQEVRKDVARARRLLEPVLENANWTSVFVAALDRDLPWRTLLIRLVLGN
ncbi:hypothetical protein L596_029985 [Steinernema carpocapsae]|uniref:Uncharacterized protein n=1 Tax=Steinernema carpocapsae TaxID=34508 RepID=A0A4U5LRE2_STECR|nr:hypothetical protein L596_029985 [Steinernema carpocapsae]